MVAMIFEEPLNSEIERPERNVIIMASVNYLQHPLFLHVSTKIKKPVYQGLNPVSSRLTCHSCRPEAASYDASEE
jgi:hypothetical protein